MNNYTQPYYGATGMQQPYSFQPMYQPIQQQIRPVQPVEQQPTFKQPIGLQGKSVDSIDVVKAMDIPLDGTVSYFPLTDGTAIVTKQLQQDGTSKTIVYKPIEEKEAKEVPQYITTSEFNEAIKKINNNEFKDDIKTMKRQIKDLVEDIKDINDYIEKRKD